MIHLIHHGNHVLYSGVLDRLFAARHQHFVVERGWELAHRDGRERDAYDDAHALHLVGFDTSGDIGVSCRIRPTLTGGVIPDVFPDLLGPGEPTPRAPGVFECTRYFAASHLRGRAGFGLRSRLHLALLELMITRRAQRLLGFVDLPLLAHLRRYSGLRLRPAGLPQPYASDGMTIAFEIGVEPDDLDQARRRLGQPGRHLFEAPAWLPASGDPVAMAQACDVLINANAAAQAELLSVARSLAARTGERGGDDAYARLREAAA